ncbi:MAG TPA: Gfo/Idh/MocA family oxidoreductase [Myxococcota bacterium]|nr:Gfo/Idh/MocA family oxidoreductase [Myxococcota bacterium]HRY94818.1 Gfo/Idh/MocA family oxidoreductase [Myxococcota bacterium]HSA22296.1 Gfo/Idh/MocA family oxidoreductase [Myxococcota bacterium]
MSWAVAKSTGERRLRVGLIGAGYFGARHASKLGGLPEVELAALVDADPERAERLARTCGAAVLPGLEALRGRVDAVVLATPATTHARLAGALLEADLHVLVEKPLAETRTEAEGLCALAEARGRVLRVGHLERFNPAFLEAARSLRAPRWLRLERLGPNPGRGLDTDVVREVMTHDLDLLGALGLEAPDEVRAWGTAIFSGRVDVACASLRWASGLEVELCASRAHARASRRLEALDSLGWLEADLAARSLARADGCVGQAPAAALAPELDPLLEQDRAFARAALGLPGAAAGASGRDGLRAVALAERILASLGAGEGAR